jgi:MoaA/NifB/PqqE/SkfB family radical SAM enzyme
MFCKQGIVGVQFSHPGRGHGLCCAAGRRYHESPNEVWFNKLSESRRNISNNIKVTDCVSCYNNESRGIKSFREIYNEQFKNFKSTALPRHMDLDFSNFCNLKCVMCGPDRSSSWAKEIGVFKENNGVVSITEKNLREICELSRELQYITLQGGEPTIIKEYQTYFQFLKDENIIENIGLNVVTNLTNINEKFFDYLPYFKHVNISVSVDAYGAANNYIRYPSNFEKISDNIRQLTNFNNLTTTIDTAIQILSMFNIKEFINWFEELEFYYHERKKNIGQYIQYVQSPEQLYILNAPTSLKDNFVKDIKDSKFEYLKEKLYSSNLYEYSKTIDYLQVINKNRNLELKNFIPNFELHYQSV